MKNINKIINNSMYGIKKESNKKELLLKDLINVVDFKTNVITVIINEERYTYKHENAINLLFKYFGDYVVLFLSTETIDNFLHIDIELKGN